MNENKARSRLDQRRAPIYEALERFRQMRVAKVIQRLHAVHVHAHALLTQKSGQLRVAAAPLVAGHVKRHHPHLPELLQRLVNRGTALVQPEPCTVLTHCFPPSLVLCTKP